MCLLVAELDILHGATVEGLHGSRKWKVFSSYPFWTHRSFGWYFLKSFGPEVDASKGTWQFYLRLDNKSAHLYFYSIRR